MTQQRRIAVDGYTDDQRGANGGGEHSIARIWNLLQKVYDLNRRDRAYAYRDAVTYARLNRLYSSFNGQCKFALLIHPGHRFLTNYLNVADELAHRRGLIVLSLTYFGDGGSGDKEKIVANDATMAKRDFERDMDLRSTSDDDNAVEPSEEECAEEEEEEEEDIGRRSNDGDYRRRDNETECEDQRDGRNDECGGGDGSGGDDDDDDEEILSVTTVRPLGKIGATAYMHNSVIETFFSELIKFVRPIPLCDEIGVISCMRTHKSYRLVHRNDLLRWYREVSSLTNDGGD